MRTFPIFFLILLIVGNVSAQSTSCPTVSVDGPAGLPTEDRYEELTVNVTGNIVSRPKFNWTISVDKIVSGQGTEKLVVKRDRSQWGMTLTGTVEVSEYGNGCKYIVSASGGTVCFIYSELLDEYDPLKWSDEKKQISRAIEFLNRDRNASLAIMLFGTVQQSRLRKIVDHIRSLDPELVRNVRFMLSDEGKPLTKIYLVPPSSELPICEPTCTTIFAKDVR